MDGEFPRHTSTSGSPPLQRTNQRLKEWNITHPCLFSLLSSLYVVSPYAVVRSTLKFVRMPVGLIVRLLPLDHLTSIFHQFFGDRWR